MKENRETVDRLLSVYERVEKLGAAEIARIHVSREWYLIFMKRYGAKKAGKKIRAIDRVLGVPIVISDSLEDTQIVTEWRSGRASLLSPLGVEFKCWDLKEMWKRLGR